MMRVNFLTFDIVTGFELITSNIRIKRFTTELPQQPQQQQKQQQRQKQQQQQQHGFQRITQTNDYRKYILILDMFLGCYSTHSITTHACCLI
jgi:hypothetical protein